MVRHAECARRGTTLQRASMNLVHETIGYGFNSNACEDESCEFHQCYVPDAEIIGMLRCSLMVVVYFSR